MERKAQVIQFPFFDKRDLIIIYRDNFVYVRNNSNMFFVM